jgi:hypothetical protein
VLGVRLTVSRGSRLENGPVLGVRLTVSSDAATRRAASRLRSGSYVWRGWIDWTAQALPSGSLK